MKVSLISPFESIVSYGIRCLSAILKEAGFETQMIFLPRETEGLPWEGFRYAYSPEILDQVAQLVDGSGLVGITLMTNYIDNAVQLTRYLRRATSAPIAWGGIHPTVRPDECLEYADVVCVGEGEEAIRELAQRLAAGEGYAGIANLWHKQDGALVRTPLRPLQFDLDVYPYPDYDPATSYVLYQGKIEQLTPARLIYYLSWPYTSDAVPTYTTMMSRGCTYACRYCCNNALRNIYHHQWRVRRRSVPNFIGELREITARFPEIRLIKIEDDNFMNDTAMLREFCAAYKREIGRPMFITGFQPPMVDEEKIAMLVDAGMRQVRMGIQTGSMRTMHEVYHRPTKREHILHAAAVLSKFSDRMVPPAYDMIVDNPWETEEDNLETLRLLLEMAGPFEIIMFSLTFYPGTELYERAKREGILQNEVEQVYRQHFLINRRSYTNGLLKLVQTQRAPRWLLKLLLGERLRRRNWVWLPYLLYSFYSALGYLQAGLRALFRGDWAAFRRAFRAHFVGPDRDLQVYRGALGEVGPAQE